MLRDKMCQAGSVSEGFDCKGAPELFFTKPTQPSLLPAVCLLVPFKTPFALQKRSNETQLVGHETSHKRELN